MTMTNITFITLGTCWTGPGEGSTVAQIRELLQSPERIAPGHTRAEFDAAMNAMNQLEGAHRTDLEMTKGELTVLQPCDLRRIACAT